MILICPICKNELKRIENSYRCLNKHNFDIARQGYLNLNHSTQHGGDSKDSIEARNHFLNNKHYDFLKEEIIKIINEYKPNSLLDLACGQGYYTKDFPVKNKIGIDLSKDALKNASRNDKNTLYLLDTIFNLPIESNSVDIITTIFAPISKEEINRTLKTNGHFIFVGPNENHLIELKENLYSNVLKNELKDIDLSPLKLIKKYSINKKESLMHDDIISLLKMTPYFYKTSKEDIKKIDELDKLDITFDFIISIYEKQY